MFRNSTCVLNKECVLIRNGTLFIILNVVYKVCVVALFIIALCGYIMLTCTSKCVIFMLMSKELFTVYVLVDCDDDDDSNCIRHCICCQSNLSKRNIKSNAKLLCIFAGQLMSLFYWVFMYYKFFCETNSNN